MTTLTAANPTVGGGLAAGGLGPRVPVPAPAPGMTGTDIWRIIRQRLVMIILIWVFVIIATTVFTAIMWKYYPTYAARAYIEVESVEPVNVMDPLAQSRVTAQEMERIVRDQAVLVESEPVLDAVIQDATVRATDWFSEAKKDAQFWGDRLVDRLDDSISATPMRDSSYVVVTARTKKPEDAALLANTAASVYLNRAENRQKEDIREARDRLQVEVEQATTEFENKIIELESFRAGEDVLNLNNERNERLATLNAMNTELELDRAGKEAQWETLSNVDPDLLPITADIQALLDQDRTIVFLEQRVQDAEHSLAYYLELGYGLKHKIVIAARSAYEAALGRLQTEEAVKASNYKNEMIQQARQSYLEAGGMLLKVQEQLEYAEAQQRDRNRKMARYLRLGDERELLRFKLEQIQQQRDVVNMTLESKKMLKIRIAAVAQAPKRKDSPRWGIWMPVGTLLGLVFAVGLALLLDMADKSVRSPRDVVRHVAIPVLGTIPTSDDDEIEIARVETASIDAPHSVVAEAFRQLRANLFFSAPAEQQGVLMVTSPSAGNGKTTVATNMAISIALSGRRVLLVDANFRRPSVARIFPGVREEGLSNVLIGQSRVADVIATTSVPGLDVVSTGPTPPNPAELLGSSYLRDLVVDARSRYDQVIFDGPPVLLVSDAAVLAGAVDGTLMVCQYRKTSRGALQRARAQLESINSRVFGAVLNMVETRAGGYFRKQYREFYDYQGPEDGAEDGGKPGRLELQAKPQAGPVTPSIDRSGTAEPPGAQRASPASESRPDFSVAGMDDTEAGTGPSARSDDVLGELRIDDSLGLGEDIEDLASGTDVSFDDSEVTREGERSTPPLDFGGDLDIDSPVDLGSSDLGSDDDDYDLDAGSEPDEGPSDSPRDDPSK